MDGTIILNNNDDETTDRSDEIVSDIISLIHSTTHSSYVTCSQLSSKLISYLSQTHIHDNQWNDLENAVKVIYE
jgi:predicted site-specific integrase-resolvase